MAIPDYSVAKRGSASIFYDPRSPLKKFLEVAAEHPVYAFAPLIAAGLMFLFPITFLIGLFVTIYFRFAFKNIPDVLPMFLPRKAKNKIDKHNVLPDGKKGRPDGSIYFGTLVTTSQELWAKFETSLRHILVLGTTGAGKTEFLLSIFSSFLAIGTGGIYSDGKGTANLMYAIFNFARIMGAEDDVHYLNYSKENTATRPDPANFQSHTCAPYSTGSADNGTQLTVSLMPEDSGGNNKVFQEAAVALIAAVFPALTDLRELGILHITPGVIRMYSNYDRFCELMRDPLITHKSREAMLGFIRTRSGYTDSKSADKQPEEVTKQFGFAQAYFTRALQLLSDSYAEIYNDPCADLDFIDLVLNDRILVNILPSMSKSPQEMGNLGKINLTSIRNALSVGLSADVQGTHEDVVETLATNTDVPVICINDEIAFYLANGFMITAAQARSLKMVMLFSSQEFASIINESKKEGEQMWANTRLKFLMASEGDDETIKRFLSSAGKVWAFVRGGLKRNESDDGVLMRDFVNGDSVSLQQVDKMEVDDVRQLNEGRAAFLYQDNLFLIKTFYHNSTFKAEQMRILRGVVPHIEPTHGVYSRVLSGKNRAKLITYRDWIKNLQQGDINFDKEMRPSERAKIIPTIRGEFDPNNKWSAAEAGIAMLYGFGHADRIIEMRKSGDAIDSAEPSFLFNASGDLGNSSTNSIFDNDHSSQPDDSSEDENKMVDVVNDMMRAMKEGKKVDFTEALKMIGSGDTTSPRGSGSKTRKQGYETSTSPSTLASIDNNEGEESNDFEHSVVAQESDQVNSSTPLITGESDDTFKQDSQVDKELIDELFTSEDPITDRTSEFATLLPDATVKRIATGTASLEKLLGASEEQAGKAAQKTVADILAATQYPKSKPVATPDIRDKLRNITERFAKNAITPKE